MFEFVQNNKTVIQVILGAVALTFVGFGVSSYSSATDDPYLVKVGNAKIYKRDLDRALEGKPSDPATRQAMLQEMIRRELVLADARDHGAAVSPAQLQKFIAAIPLFQENGKFSAERYSEFLKNRYPSAEAFETEISQDLLVRSQLTAVAGTQFVPNAVVGRIASLLGEGRELQPLVIKPSDFAAEVKTDDAAIKAYYDANAKRFRTAEQIKLDYVVLSQDAVAQGVKVSDAEIQKYYDQHKGDLAGEQRRASHILLAVAKDAKPEQKAKVRAEAEAILKEARANPAKFAELAKAKSQDPGSAEKGGDLGFFGHGMMVKQFDDVVFRMKPGQISEVVETEYGFHIIRLDEVKAQSLDDVKSVIVDKLQKQKAAGLFRAESDKLNEISYQQADSLKGVVDALKLEVKHSDWIVRNQPSQDPLLGNARLLAAAFSDDVLKKKHNSEVVDVGGGRLVVARVAEHQPEHQQAIAEVSAQIKSELIARDGAKLADKKGQAVLADLKAGKSVEGLQWGPNLTVSRRAPSLPPADMRAAFAVSGAKLPGYAGVRHDTGEYVVYRVGKVIPAPALSEADRAQLGGMLNEMTANGQLVGYLQALRQKYPVVPGKQSLNDNSN
ncbi:SurA N-terminal domain-containing protein [Chromobacterium sp. IIBBL 290-4]|uniref:SurA N-terminal domain-containing protein n=1 Tax=Chromobacterium sp. IIBBL 290-4 TaxID=2953890 RepID=UPI0020B7FAE3|nr:SurA N-terminal domain-containing protein [Chromobacterium sp. IIBBL 290-4]UTH73211.1 SurA N-terminal domain-containing protein [Chromobacterium sp. IIBBL 290-4]